MKHFGSILLACAGPLSSMPGQAVDTAPDASDFARHPAYSQIKISPDGTYVGVSAEVDGQAGLLVIRLSDKQIVSRFALGLNGAIDDYWWVGPERIVVSGAIQYGSLDQPRPIGELIGVDADGKNRAYLLGYRAPIGKIGAIGNRGRNIDLRSTVDVAEMIDPLPGDPAHALVAVHTFDAGSEVDAARVYKLDVYSGARSVVTTAPIPGWTRFLADRGGTIRYVVGEDDRDRPQTYVRSDEGAWSLVNTKELAGAHVEPIIFGSDDTAYLRSDENDGYSCLFEQNLISGRKKQLSCEPGFDLQRVVLAFDRSHPIAAVYEPGRPELRYLDDSDPDRILLEKIQNSFPGETVLPTSATLDGKRIILHVFGDRDPGRFFLFDKTTEKAVYLLSTHGWADPKNMAERRPISYTARDGESIHGFITLPLGRDAKALPMIVMPHGGPFGIHDDWAWEANAQWLAANGYAVLQPNFRGSGNYGAKFLNAGRHGWDSVMINDITDGTRWAIAQGYADAARIGIFGGSYGGYAALMSAVREPELYRCVVDYAGVVDLKLWRRETDVSNTASGRNYIESFVGADDARLLAASPLTLIDRLKAPILIAHGEEDVRVPFSQAKALRKALDQRKLPYEWLIKPGEGHGFFKPENRAELLTKMVEFFDRNLAPTAADSGTNAGKTTEAK